MKIVKLTAQNVKRLSAVQIEPSGNIVEIRGANGAGKTSVLDSIWMAMGGKSASPEQPIRQGEKTATATVHLGPLIIRRTWTENGTYLAVTTQEGHQYKSPQKVLDELVGSLTFDPLEFSRMCPTDRRGALLDLLDVEGTLLELERRERFEYEARRAASKSANEHRVTSDSLSVPDDTPENPVDVAALTGELDQAYRLKASNDDARRALTEKQNDAERLRQRTHSIRDQIVEAQGRVEKLKAAEQAAEVEFQREVDDRNLQSEHVQQLADPDIAAIQTKLQSAESINAAVAQRVEGHRHGDKAREYADVTKKHDLNLTVVKNERRRLLHDAAWPVDGLTIDSDAVYFRGVAFDQCSASEKLRVSLNIAMAMNPRLKVLLVRDGSLLDDESLKLLYDEVNGADYQLWIERVGDDGEVGIVIEDGHVRGDEREPGLPYAEPTESGSPEVAGQPEPGPDAPGQ